MTTITRRARDLRSRIDAAVAVAVVLTSICLAIAAGAFVAATRAEPPLAAANTSSVAVDDAADPGGSIESHDDHMS